MRVERRSLTAQDAAEPTATERAITTLAAEIRSLVPAGESVGRAVAEIIAAVRRGGDQALRELTARYDHLDSPPDRPLSVPAQALAKAVQTLDPAVRAGLERASENVRRVAESSLVDDRTVEIASGHQITLRHVPVRRAAVYVPGGRAPYPSTVVMGAVAARAAGVAEIAVCSPPGPNGEVHEAVLAACQLTGVERVYRIGGAQSIAALAYGTETVAPVDVVVGPGNLYVQEAKRQVSGQVGIDGFAGPSDLVLVGGEPAPAQPLALDLLAQAEHGPGSLVVAISDSRALLDALATPLADAAETGAVAVLVSVANAATGVALANAIAPEHLQLVGPGPEALARSATTAGCLFVGPASATAFGDYVAGSNHVLPTGGAARFASGLSPGHFRRSYSEVRLGARATGELARAAAPIARAEGFELHARSMEARGDMRENPES